MKITIYELLGLIKDGKAPKKIKEPQGSYIETYVFDKKEQWYITKDDTTKMNIWNKERLSNEIEIIEEVEDKEYEDIEEIKSTINGRIMCKYDGEQHYLDTNIKDKAVYVPLLNALIRNQKYILERLDK